jgi:ABC-type Fe3+ transport system permease subunit
VTVPIALPSIVAISMYFFLNAMVTLSAVVFLVRRAPSWPPSRCS